MQRHFLLIAGLPILLSITACQATIPKQALELAPESLEKRQLQTRKYEGIAEETLLSAAAGVMQDLGFNIDESETKLGLIAGSKDRDATEAGQIVGAIFVAALTGVAMPTDHKQKMKASLVVRPAPGDIENSHYVRVTFQRIVWNTQNQVSRIEGIEDPDKYQEFFSRLSKAVFLEGHTI